MRVPTEKDGAVRIYYSKHRADRFVSAVDVLEDRVDPALLRKQMVLIGPTAFGLQELHDTPIGERMSGSEIQAQLLENMSRTSPWAWSLTIDRISVLTRVTKTIGFLPSCSAV